MEPFLLEPRGITSYKLYLSDHCAPCMEYQLKTIRHMEKTCKEMLSRVDLLKYEENWLGTK